MRQRQRDDQDGRIMEVNIMNLNTLDLYNPIIYIINLELIIEGPLYHLKFARVK